MEINIGQSLPLICNAAMSDADAEIIIESACEAAASQVRSYLEQRRINELSRVAEDARRESFL